MPAKLRLAGEADLDTIVRLAELVHQLHHSQAPRVAVPPGQLPAKRELWSSKLAGGTRLWVAEDPSGVVGFIDARIENGAKNSLVKDLLVCKIGSVAVEPRVREQGIGSALMQAARDWARSQGAVEMRLNVWEFNADARELYEHMGFTTRSRAMVLVL